MFVHIAAAATLYMLKRPVRGGECGPAAETYSVQVPETSSLGAYVRCVYSSSELSCLLAKFLHTWGKATFFHSRGEGSAPWYVCTWSPGPWFVRIRAENTPKWWRNVGQGFLCSCMLLTVGGGGEWSRWVRHGLSLGNVYPLVEGFFFGVGCRGVVEF